MVPPPASGSAGALASTELRDMAILRLPRRSALVRAKVVPHISLCLMVPTSERVQLWRRTFRNAWNSFAVDLD